MTPTIHEIYRRREISCAHQLHLPYDSKCNVLHGHNYIVEVWITSTNLNAQEMIMDYTNISKIIDRYDHQNLNDFMETTTAERFAEVLAETIGQAAMACPGYIATKVHVWETANSWAGASHYAD